MSCVLLSFSGCFVDIVDIEAVIGMYPPTACGYTVGSVVWSIIQVGYIEFFLDVLLSNSHNFDWQPQ